MALKIGINGFGRIGRSVLRALIQQDFPLEVGLINEPSDLATNAHLLAYDSVHGRLDQPVKVQDQGLKIGSTFIPFSNQTNPEKIAWQEQGVDLVLECTGRFTKRADASLHLKANAKRVLISAPAKEPDITLAFGINHNQFDPSQHQIISNASCTTNCLAPVAKVLHQQFNILEGFMTTVHSYTNDQRILDVGHSDLRRARAAAVSQIPTKTGAAAAVGLVLPELKGKIDGMAIRVPTPNVSCVDLVCRVEKSVTLDSINEAFLKESQAELSGVLAFSDEPLVSVDYNGNPHSAIVDGLSTKVINDHLVKVLAWYDNEAGFSNRMVDMAQFLIKNSG